MTQEEKQLLLKDLCARLPYGVIVHNEEGHEGYLNSINQTIFGVELGVNITATRRVDFQLDTCKPYLRPMSSMTEEEKDEYDRLVMCNASWVVDDWLNAHQFDYRGLIPVGLALEVPEGMY
jgi:hypothetical protein